MKREEFLKMFGAFTGGLMVVGCSSDLISDVVGSGGDEIDIDEAQSWFVDSYVKKYSIRRMSFDNKEFKRVAVWKDGLKMLNSNNRDFLWIPLEYDQESRPAVVIYTDSTAYRLQMAKYYVQPIIEGLVVVKENGIFNAFLAQIAYDPIAVASNNYKLEKAKFTGTLIKCDWNNNVIGSLKYVRGQQVPYGNSGEGVAPTARQQNCETVRYAYQYWKMIGDEFAIVQSHIDITNCEIAPGVFSGSPWPSGFFDPYGSETSSGSGGGSGQESNYLPINSIVGFNVQNALSNGGSDRNAFNNNLTTAFMNSASGGVSALGWTWDKADVMARSVGLDLQKFLPAVNIGGKAVGIAGLSIVGTSTVFGVTQIAMAVAENGLSWDTVGWTGVSTALGVVGFVGATAFAAPWIAFTTSTISVGIAVYTLYDCPTGDCPKCITCPQ